MQTFPVPESDIARLPAVSVSNSSLNSAATDSGIVGFAPAAEFPGPHSEPPILVADDDPDILSRRLIAYRGQTAPLSGYFHLQNVLRTVDGMATATANVASAR